MKTKVSLLLPLDLQFFGQKELEQKMLEAVNALHNAADRRDEEAKQFGEATAETKQMLERVNADITEVKKQLDAMAAKGNRVHKEGHEEKGGAVDLERKEAFMQFLRGGKASLTQEQKTALNKVPEEYKALVEDTVGEIVVPEDLDSTLYTELRKNVVLRQLAHVRKTSSNRVRRIGMGQVTSGWGKLEITPNQKLSDYESNPTPTEAYINVQNLYGLAKLGEDELMDSSLNLIEYLAKAFAEEFAERESEGYLRGAGSASNQPEGILLNSAIKRTVTEAANGISTDDLLKLMYGVPSQYRSNGAFLTSSAVELAIRTLKSGDGVYMWQPSVQEGKPNLFMGKPVYVEDHFDGIASGNEVAVFGNFNRGVMITDRAGLTITRISELYAEEDMIGFKAKKRTSSAVVRPDALAILKVQ